MLANIAKLSDMIFNSMIFMAYLPIVFLCYWFVFPKLKWQNAFIVVASYVFYGWWDCNFLILIAITSLCSYLSGIFISNSKSKSRKRLILVANVVLNLGILGTFKYFNFFVSNLQHLLSHVGISLDSVTLNLILPVGISFYTFQALSYSIDVYRDKIKPTRDIIAFFAFISFFPQLVAGPIERATNLLPQFLSRRKFNYALAIDGCRQILWGLFKKMVIADNCANSVNMIFQNYENLGGMDLWLGAFLFTIQIYGDFSGYSDIAIGTAKLFDIKLMQNFNLPYFSRNISEFWRRWHISLNTWFVDYIYIPLGGSRCKKSKNIRNILIVFLLSGLWHGAEWTFVAWGAYNAVLFIPHTLVSNRKYTNTVATGKILPTMNESLLMGRTFLLVMVGWVLFRSDNMTLAIDYLAKMFTDFHSIGNLNGMRPIIFIMILGMLIIEWLQRDKKHPYDISGDNFFAKKFIRWTLYWVTILIIFLYSGQQSDFIYFQF